MRYRLFILSLLAGLQTFPQTDSPAIRLASTVFNTWKDDGDTSKTRFTYDQGLTWQGLLNLWYNTGDGRYFTYVQHLTDNLVSADGRLQNYKQEGYNLDNILCGPVLLRLYQTTGQEKYYKAASNLQRQLREQPHSSEGNSWHKKKYSEQLWLDGTYMVQPFFAAYAVLSHEDSVFAGIARQFALLESYTRDRETGLFYHGWDESRQQKWARNQSGHSANFWARAMGWYGMALVDALEQFPAGHPGRKDLLAILTRYAIAIQKAQDPISGCWWNMLDKPNEGGNFLEVSSSCMFTYALAKGVRLGYLPETYRIMAEKAYQGILRLFVTTDSLGHTSLQGTVNMSELGGRSSGDGTIDYYISEKIVPNDPKGIGAFLLAAGEMAMKPADKKTVLLDYYFNNERRKDPTGTGVRYHYTWEDQANSGFSLWGHLFRMNGAHTDSLPTAPTAEKLKKAAVYIIVDPDDEKEVPSPNYPDDHDIAAIGQWVRAGGVLVLMSNDSANCEFPHFNQLAEHFGIHFNFNDYHKVTGNHYEMGAFRLPENDSIFRTTKKIYIKELSTLQLSGTAHPAYVDSGNTIMAVARIGKGTVFAVGDPWFYNEYTDGRKLPADFQNYNAASDLARWLLNQK